MLFSKYIRRRIYKWHRITSIIIIIPVLLWTISGLMHAIMSYRKPATPNNRFTATPINVNAIKTDLANALYKNNIDSIESFRIVALKGFQYYQVKTSKSDSLIYLSCLTGEVWKDGDNEYAHYLAQNFLTEPITKTSHTNHHEHSGKEALGLMYTNNTSVFNSTNIERIKSSNRLHKFNDTYKPGNKILPVHEVIIDREDELRLYIDTRSDKLVTVLNNERILYTKFFSFAHSFSFLNELGKWKHIITGTLSALCFISSVSGFYVYNISKRKKRIKHNTQRSWHRTLGNIFLITTLLFAFSGAWHAFNKLSSKPILSNAPITPIPTSALLLPIQFLENNKTPYSAISIVQMNDQYYWQLGYNNNGKQETRYYNTEDLELLSGGNGKYAKALALRYSNQPASSVKAIREVNKYSHSYSSMNKRLPVVEVSFLNGDKYFVETSTGSLAAIIKPRDEAERFSFSNLHMHHFWESWFNKHGKTIKNIILILSTGGLLILAALGLSIYIKKRFTIYRN